MKFVKVADPQGNDVWIVSQWVTKVSYAVGGTYVSGARAVISMGANQQAVKQTPEEIVRLLEQES